jgi:phage-related protein
MGPYAPTAAGRPAAANVRARRILVLHGFIKKTQKTPPDDLALARRRNREFEK